MLSLSNVLCQTSESKEVLKRESVKEIHHFQSDSLFLLCSIRS